MKFEVYQFCKPLFDYYRNENTVKQIINAYNSSYKSLPSIREFRSNMGDLFEELVKILFMKNILYPIEIYYYTSIFLSIKKLLFVITLIGQLWTNYNLEQY